MDPPCKFRAWSPDSHHHHHPPLSLCSHHYHYHYYFSPHCPFHGHLNQSNSHSQARPLFPFPPLLPQNPEYVASVPSMNHLNSPVSQPKESYTSDVLMTQEANEELEAEDEEDPIFVLTDEWREFFAKSEAKRRLAKEASKKKKKN